MACRHVLFAVLVAACSHRQAPGPVTAQEPPEVGVIVESQYGGIVTVFLDASGRSTRLGEVHFQETRSFVVPWRTVGDGGTPRLRGEVIGSAERVATSDLRLSPGSVVRWTLTPRLSMSYYAVY
jgi:hypothetical protein